MICCVYRSFLIIMVSLPTLNNFFQGLRKPISLHDIKQLTRSLRSIAERVEIFKLKSYFTAAFFIQKTSKTQNISDFLDHFNLRRYTIIYVLSVSSVTMCYAFSGQGIQTSPIKIINLEFTKAFHRYIFFSTSRIPINI